VALTIVVPLANAGRLALTIVVPFGNAGRVRADEISTTSLHDTGEGRAGKRQKSQSVDHFEELKVFFGA
jgi:hypothetical protein